MKEQATSKYFILMYFENIWTAGQNRPKQHKATKKKTNVSFTEYNKNYLKVFSPSSAINVYCNSCLSKLTL